MQWNSFAILLAGFVLGLVVGILLCRSAFTAWKRREMASFERYLEEK